MLVWKTLKLTVVCERLCPYVDGVDELLSSVSSIVESSDLTSASSSFIVSKTYWMIF